MYDQTQDPRNRRLFSTKDVAKYALLPGIFPRLGRLSSALSGFLFMFTQILGSSGLIEANHPCLRYENRHSYPFTYVLGLAWSNVKFDKENMPKTGMFFGVIIAILLLIGMLISFVGKLLLGVNEAHAQFFGTPSFTGPDGKTYSPNTDWAFKFLDRIFGDASYTGVDFWTSTGVAQNPWFSSLFAGMMQHYSLALLFIAAMMILYLLIITIGEAARTGKPFGTRFDSVWAPIRLAMAIGLLIPISGKGYNAAQLIVFQASEWGSNLATNVWYAGLDKAGNTTFVAKPATDRMARLIRDMLMINICTQSIVATDGPVHQMNDGDLKAKVSKAASAGKISYSYGVEEDPTYCGLVEVPLEFAKFNMLSQTYSLPDGTSVTLRVPDQAAFKDKVALPRDMSTGAITFLQNIVNANFKSFSILAPEGLNSGAFYDSSSVVSGDMPITAPSATLQDGSNIVSHIVSWPNNKKIAISTFVTPQAVRHWVTGYRTAMQFKNPTTLDPNGPYQLGDSTGTNLKDFNQWLIDSLRKDGVYGWTTAGVFYLRISNGFSLVEKATEGPVVKSMPKNYTKYYATPGFSAIPTEFLIALCSNWFTSLFAYDACGRMENAASLSSILRLSDAALISAPIQSSDGLYAELGGPQWTEDLAQPNQDSPTNISTNSVFGFVTKKLVDSVKISGDSLNPLGQVISWGHTLMRIANAAYLVGIIGSVLSPGLGDLGLTLGHSFMIPGFILAFYVPMQPFLYFMFSVIEWMISILEAIIGVPLWCLSFISLEGDFLGKSMTGVKMIFELVLRPTIIVIALVVAILIFSASIQFVNDSFTLFLGAYNGAESGNMGPVASAVGGFAMMLIYMFLIYSLATSCFKLVDVIPNEFGRWLELPKGFGSSIKTGIDNLSGAVAGGAVLSAANATIKGAAGVTKDGLKAAGSVMEYAAKDKDGNVTNAKLASFGRGMHAVGEGGLLHAASGQGTLTKAHHADVRAESRSARTEALITGLGNQHMAERNRQMQSEQTSSQSQTAFQQEMRDSMAANQKTSEDMMTALGNQNLAERTRQMTEAKNKPKKPRKPPPPKKPKKPTQPDQQSTDPGPGSAYWQNTTSTGNQPFKYDVTPSNKKKDDDKNNS